MKPDHSGRPGGLAAFSNQYLHSLRSQRVKQSQLQWYARRLGRYLDTMPKPPHQQSGEDVVAFLTEIGRKGELRDWQYRQAVHSLEIFFVHTLKSGWAGDFDWQHWKDSARRLEPRHATIAREHPIRARAKTTSKPVSELRDRVQVSYPEVMDSLVAEIRRRAYSIRTEQAYENWVARFIALCEFRAPGDLGGGDVKRYLEYLAVDRCVSANTQNQALNAIVFLYEQVLDRPRECVDTFTRAKRPRRLPVVLSRGEVRDLLANLKGTRWLMAGLLCSPFSGSAQRQSQAAPHS